MIKRDVRSPVDALVYLVDCQLATVEDVVRKRSSPQYAINRHISIAQQGVDWMRQHNVDFSSTRAEYIVNNYGGSVLAWAARYKV